MPPARNTDAFAGKPAPTEIAGFPHQRFPIWPSAALSIKAPHRSSTSLQDLYSSPPDLSDNLPGIALGFPHRGRKSHGLHLSATRCGVFHHSGRPGLRLCGARQETVMTGFYLFGGIIAAGLLVYLIAALLFPEDFL
jgi:K+-transporting ATPase KdpF subunit